MATAAELKKQYEDAARKALDLEGGGVSFKDMLDRSYDEKMNYNKDLINQKNSLQEESFTLPAQERVRYAESAIRNPLVQEQLISDRRSNIGLGLSNAVDLLNARGLNKGQIISGAVDGYGAEVNKAKSFADILRQSFLDQQDEERYQEQMAMQRAAAGGGAGGYGPDEFGDVLGEETPRSQGGIYRPSSKGGHSSSISNSGDIVRPTLLGAIPGVGTGIGTGVAYDKVASSIAGAVSKNKTAQNIAGKALGYLKPEQRRTITNFGRTLFGK